MRSTPIALAVLLATAATQPAAAQQDYLGSTPPAGSWASGAWIGFGNVVGQTFTASSSTLDVFGFYASSNWTGNGTFRAALYAVTGSAISGSALYSSSILNYTSITTGWFDFFTGGVGLTPGAVYMALLAPSWVTNGAAIMNLGVEAGDAYAGASGRYATLGLPTTATSLQGATWYAVGGTAAPGRDLALRLGYASEVITTTGGEEEEETLTLLSDPLDFPTTATPEPASMVLLATGLVGLAGVGRLRRKRTA